VLKAVPNSQFKRKQSFSLTSRLSRNDGFGHVIDKRYVADDCFKVIFVANNQAVARLGISASKKFLPAAVQRNCAKRIIREAFRQHDVRWKGLDIVVLVRRTFLKNISLSADKLRKLFAQTESKCVEL